jgi:exopolyphosphatase/guanosine-5'-triphosphate,3'-diphosphate pyrophosphatase
MPRPPKQKLIAVIDVGSNSVRLVVYRGLKRSPDIIFNERVLCGLASGVTSTGRMDEAAIDMALAALGRFAHLCDDMNVDRIEAVATAAVRDSENGLLFVERIEETCGFKVQVLSGKKEAKLSAYGVLSGFPGAGGVVADLGGGSLELAAIEGGNIIEKTSLPIGPLRLMAGLEKYTSQHAIEVAKALKTVTWLPQYKGKPFYMVGGAWRMIAHIHIIQTGWPLHLLHGYRLEGRAAKTFSDVLSKQSAASLKEIPGVTARRAVILPLSARILSEILGIVEAGFVYTSAYGLREGLLYKSLAHQVRREDPLIAHVKEFGNRSARFASHGELLSSWINPIFPDQDESDKRLREAACHISDISWKSHPDFKGDLAFTRALVARFVGVSHAERVQIALALYIAYGGKKKDKTVKKICKICRPEEIEKAVANGLAIRLGLRLTGGTGEPLKKTSLTVKRGKLILTIRETDQALAGVIVLARLKTLAAHFGLDGEIKIRH